MKTETIKQEIRKTYGAIATNNHPSTCCASETGCCQTGTISHSMSEGYAGVKGHQDIADLGLGCGLPTEWANIRKGDTVIDLGSGAGNDAFIARSLTGSQGQVIGIDMTPEMVIRAFQNTHKLGFNNVSFVLGEIENMNEIPDDTADVAISNCVMNLVTGKEKAFSEIHRILKTGGHFSISDIVYKGTLPQSILKAAELYAGCVAGASEKGHYLGIIKKAGFKNIEVKTERPITLPDDLLLNYLSKDELEAYKKTESGIYSITVNADKLEDGNCCNASGDTCCSGNDTAATTDKTTCCGSETTKTNHSSCCK